MRCRQGVARGCSTDRAAGQHNLRCYIHAGGYRRREGQSVARSVPGGQGRPESRVSRAAGQGPPRRRLWRAWLPVRANNGALGIDKTTLAEVGQDGAARVSQSS